MPVADARVPVRNQRTAYRVVADRGLLVVVDKRELHTLNPVGARVWALCDGRDVDAIVSQIAIEFEVAPERAQQDVEAFLRTLHDVGALTWGQS